MHEPILTARDTNSDALVRIDNARSGHRYQGINEHESCLLYPRFPADRRPSFVHMPGKSECPKFTGESREHRDAKERWVKYLEDQLSGCPICVSDGRDAYPNHEHHVVNNLGEPIESGNWPRACHGVLWFCQTCSQPHVEEILGDAVSVQDEWWTPGRGARIDIALLNTDENPVCLIEVEKTHLSDNALKYAEQKDIPLFVLNVAHGIGNAQSQLHHNGLTSPTDWPDFTNLKPRNFDFVHHSMPGVTYVARTDGEGNLTHQIRHEAELDDRLCNTIPQPSIGQFILASRSTVSCQDYKDKKWSEWLIPV